MNNYTVLLLRPDYIADEFGKDTYLAWVAANGVHDAIRTAQVEAVEADLDESTPPEDVNPGDYHVLFVCLGHQVDLKP